MFKFFKKQKRGAIHDPFLDSDPFIKSLTGSYMLDTITAAIMAFVFFAYFFGGAS